jgi:uncharacterized protein YjbI with pentapeptide repeats
LTDRILFGADLREAMLDRARLVRCDKRGATLRAATLPGADLSHADLRNGTLFTVAGHDLK